MGQGFNISVDNNKLRNLIKELKNRVDEKAVMIDAEILGSVTDMQFTAKQLAPASNDTVNSTGGVLRGAIEPLKNGFMDYSLVCQKDYAPYMEFGTGNYAASYVKSLEPEWEALAATYFVSGKGRILPRPFMVPAIRKHTPEIIQKIKDILND